MVVGGRPLLPEILGQRDPVGAKSPILRFLTEFASFASRLRHSGWTDNVRKILSPSSSLPLFGQN